MKKIISVVLALMLLYSGAALAESAAAAVSPVDSALDQAFTAGKVSLIESDLPVFSPEDAEFVLPPDSFWETPHKKRITRVTTSRRGAQNTSYDILTLEKPAEEDLRAMLSDGKLTVTGFSPDGSAAIGYLEYWPVAVSGNRIVFLYPAESRGIEDPYHFAEKVYQAFLSDDNRLGTVRQGVVWSPDGRYFSAVTPPASYPYLTAGPGNIIGAPVLTDTQTGEMFCIDVFNPEDKTINPEDLTVMENDDFGRWVMGCFSGDGQSFFALYTGNRYGRRNMLLRYDLDSFSPEMLENPRDLFCDYLEFPSLSVGPDERVTLLVREFSGDMHYCLSQISAGKSVRRQALTLFERPKLYTEPVRILTSGNSGISLVLSCITDQEILSYAQPVIPSSLMRLDADDPATIRAQGNLIRRL